MTPTDSSCVTCQPSYSKVTICGKCAAGSTVYSCLMNPGGITVYLCHFELLLNVWSMCVCLCVCFC